MKLKFDNKVRQAMYDLFKNGGKHSVAELSKRFNNPDPRSHIRYIREAGVPITSTWVKFKNNKYKVYFINKEDIAK